MHTFSKFDQKNFKLSFTGKWNANLSSRKIRIKIHIRKCKDSENTYRRQSGDREQRQKWVGFHWRLWAWRPLLCHDCSVKKEKESLIACEAEKMEAEQWVETKGSHCWVDWEALLGSPAETESATIHIFLLLEKENEFICLNSSAKCLVYLLPLYLGLSLLFCAKNNRHLGIAGVQTNMI